MRIRPVSALAPCLALGLALGGCGGGGGSSNGEAGKSAAQIIVDARAALTSATSVHLTGSGTDMNFGQVTFDAHATQDGCTASLKLQSGTLALLRIGSAVYLKAPVAVLRALAPAGISTSALQLAAGSWLKLPLNLPQLQTVLRLCGVHNVDALLAPTGQLAKGAQSTTNGKKVIVINESANGRAIGSIAVATTGKAYPVEAIGGPGAPVQGTALFSDWNAHVSLTAPNGAIDVTSLLKH